MFLSRSLLTLCCSSARARSTMRPSRELSYVPPRDLPHDLPRESYVRIRSPHHLLRVTYWMTLVASSVCAYQRLNRMTGLRITSPTSSAGMMNSANLPMAIQ